ncbi:hypothetical protein DFH06DRAFT_1208764 [Mycena polygramma]|nr:hypothetical protein DFH06DRAFT_1208764 [Mycena polygramma]
MEDLMQRTPGQGASTDRSIRIGQGSMRLRCYVVLHRCVFLSHMRGLRSTSRRRSWTRSWLLDSSSSSPLSFLHHLTFSPLPSLLSLSPLVYAPLVMTLISFSFSCTPKAPSREDGSRTLGVFIRLEEQRRLLERRDTARGVCRVCRGAPYRLLARGRVCALANTVARRQK